MRNARRPAARPDCGRDDRAGDRAPNATQLALLDALRWLRAVSLVALTSKAVTIRFSFVANTTPQQPRQRRLAARSAMRHCRGSMSPLSRSAAVVRAVMVRLAHSIESLRKQKQNRKLFKNHEIGSNPKFRFLVPFFMMRKTKQEIV
jgi:hypothetical protein